MIEASPAATLPSLPAPRAPRAAGRIGAWLKAALLLPALLTGGCSTVDIINALVPTSDFKLTADRPYGSETRQKLDIYVPVTGPEHKPVVVFFYGGNWRTGSKADYKFVGEALASRGFIAVLPDYRLVPDVAYPEFLEDSAAATIWTLDHIAEFGGDPAAVHLMGHSAGAYNAMMLALDPRWLGSRRKEIRSTVGLAGPYDFLPLTDPDIQAVFSPEADLRRTQPITFADGSAAPVFLLQGLTDTVVYPRNAIRLAQRIREHGGKVETRYYDDLSHARLVGAMAKPLRFLAPVLDDVTAFLDQR